ncbi:MAG TPA: hypothetical protein VKT78_17385, partial [Fimbriimonadaceae bacterium]|nr:hypothetical protein [Fimbriimonadaceae bacterium]
MLPLALLIALGPTKHPIAPTRAELATKYKTFNQAVIRSDAAACVKLMWPDYVYVFSDDTLMRRQEYLSRLFTTVHDL